MTDLETIDEINEMYDDHAHVARLIGRRHTLEIRTEEGGWQTTRLTFCNSCGSGFSECAARCGEPSDE